jgi:hypothetical protein
MWKQVKCYFVLTISSSFLWVILLQAYCKVASRCLLGVDSSRLNSRFHLSLFALYSFFFCVSNALRSCSCRPQISFCSFLSAVMFCFSYNKRIHKFTIESSVSKIPTTNMQGEQTVPVHLDKNGAIQCKKFHFIFTVHLFIIELFVPNSENTVLVHLLVQIIQCRKC